MAGAWEKYDMWLNNNFEWFDRMLIERAGVSQGHRVLDLGSGTGNPALAAAKIAGPEGSVDGLDLAEKMLEVARKRAGAQGIQNARFHACDAGAIPFEDESFDAATSRFCLMFVPELGKVLSQVHRVLKPGARFTACVWGDANKNLSFTLAMRVLGEFVEMPPPDPDGPGMFNLGKPGFMSAKLAEAGFTGAVEEPTEFTMTFPSMEFYLDNMREMAAPVKVILETLDEPTRAMAMERIREEAAKSATESGELKFTGEAMVVSAAKGTA